MPLIKKIAAAPGIYDISDVENFNEFNCSGETDVLKKIECLEGLKTIYSEIVKNNTGGLNSQPGFDSSSNYKTRDYVCDPVQLTGTYSDKYTVQCNQQKAAVQVREGRISNANAQLSVINAELAALKKSPEYINANSSARVLTVLKWVAGIGLAILAIAGVWKVFTYITRKKSKS